MHIRPAQISLVKRRAVALLPFSYASPNATNLFFLEILQSTSSCEAQGGPTVAPYVLFWRQSQELRRNQKQKKRMTDDTQHEVKVNLFILNSIFFSFAKAQFLVELPSLIVHICWFINLFI